MPLAYSASISSGQYCPSRVGEPLLTAEREFFEPRFGVDFDSVRLHTGEPAASLATAVGAQAFTLDPDIVIGEGGYAPGTGSGRVLLAHELTHTGRRSLTWPGRRRWRCARHQPTEWPGRLQRLLLTNGQFGRAMQKYQRDVGVPDRPFRLIRRSSQFMNMLRVLDRHDINLYEPSLPTYYETGPDGRLTNDRDANERWEAFQNSSSQSPAARECILQQHARAYFDSGVIYQP